jgi:hypothetical protein
VLIPTENVDTQSRARKSTVRSVYIPKCNRAKRAVNTDRVAEQSETIQVRTESGMIGLRREEKHPVQELDANCNINIIYQKEGYKPNPRGSSCPFF